MNPLSYAMLTEKMLENNKEMIKKHQYKLFNCYAENSPDTRCCGICYCCCPVKNSDDDSQRCDVCPIDFGEYWYSGYVQTSSGNGRAEEEINGICCWFCFPLKISLFFPCLLGSLFNHAVNKCCATTCCATLGGCSSLNGCAAPIKRNYLC
jgi:hypothetical protein